jgi:hypothetical protein
MIRVFRTEGDESLLDVLRTYDPIEAEAHYLRLIQTRTDGPGVVIVNAPRRPDVLPARYRTDRDWPAEREQEAERREQQWTSGLPTVPQIRAMALVACLSGAQAAALVGASDSRTWRRWTGGERAMPPAAYWWLLVATGLHPEFRGTTNAKSPHPALTR